MKYLVLSITVFLLSFQSIQAQSKKELSAMLSRDLKDYKRYTLELNFDSSLRYMPVKMFDIIPFDSLKASMLQSMDNEYMTIQMTRFEFDSKKKPKIKKAGEYFWAYVAYSGNMRLTIKGKEDFSKILVPILKDQFGANNVQMEGASVMNIALKNKELIAFKDPALHNWSMIEDKRGEPGPEGEQQKALFSAIMPTEVLTAVDGRRFTVYGSRYTVHGIRFTGPCTAPRPP